MNEKQMRQIEKDFGVISILKRLLGEFTLQKLEEVKLEYPDFKSYDLSGEERYKLANYFSRVIVSDIIEFIAKHDPEHSGTIVESEAFQKLSPFYQNFWYSYEKYLATLISRAPLNSREVTTK